MYDQNTTAKLSVIIPVAHAELNLPKIEKMILQGLSCPAQFVIVHDIMYEQESPGLARFVTSYPNLEVILVSLRAGNPGTARNFGLNLSTGGWICFWDADDEANLKEMRKLIDQAELGNFEVCIGSYQIVSKEKVTDRILKPQSGLNQVAANPGLWRFCIRSEIARAIDFPPIKMGEDQIYLLRLNLPTRRILFSESIVYRYVNGQSLQTTNSKSSRKEIKESLALAIKILVSQKKYRTKFTKEVVVRQVFTTFKVCGFRNLMSVLFSENASLGFVQLLTLLPMFIKIALCMAYQKTRSFLSRNQQEI